MAKALDLRDLNDYRGLIEKLPNINRYVLFQDNQHLPSGFLYSFTNLPFMEKQSKENDKTPSDVTDDQLQSGTDNDCIITLSTLDNTMEIDNYEVCYGNHTDINNMLTAFWPYILKYMNENPEHDHTKQWTTWIKNGMNEQAMLNEIKQLMGVNTNTFDQLYLILQDSPALQPYSDLQWDHKIHYHLKSCINETSDMNLNLETPELIFGFHTIHQMDESDAEFRVLHKLVFDMINTWSQQDDSKLHDNWMTWKGGSLPV